MPDDEIDAGAAFALGFTMALIASDDSGCCRDEA